MNTATHKPERRLAAIFAADVAGYSRLMGQDEAGTLRSLTSHRETMDRLIAEHRGRIANTAGDSVLAEFPSVVDAVECAAEVQERLREANARVPQERRVAFRIGVHLGDVVVRGVDLLGDGVNVAARIEGVAEPGGVAISEDAYRQVLGKTGRSFQDLGEKHLKNIDQAIRVYSLHRTVEDQRPEVPLPDKPSIAVLPFANVTGHPAEDHIGDGIAEEITAALSRFRSFFVISRNSSFTYKHKSVDPRTVSRELGVRYVVEGSVRSAGERLRVMAHLIDATTGTQVWTGRYEGALSDIFDLQDRVTEAVVGAIEPTITVSEIERAKRKRPESLTAYDYVMRALPAIWSQDTDTTEGGLRLAERAIELDPNYALPKAVAAWCYAQRLSYLRTKDVNEDRHRARMLAHEAARLDPGDPLVLTCAGAAYTITRDYALGQTLIERALSIDPNSAWAWHRSGWLKTYTRQMDEALEHFRRAMRLSPIDPLTFNVFIGMGVAYFEKGEYDKAIDFIERGLRDKPDAIWAKRLLTAAYFQAGRLDDAKRTFADFQDHFPGLTVTTLIERTPGSDAIRAKFADIFGALGLSE